MSIDTFTINLHNGARPELVQEQIHAHDSLIAKYDIQWNLRSKRYPKAYPSYSQLMNHAIATSPTEYMVFVNDRTTCTAEYTEKIINLLQTGYSCVFLYNVGYMGFTKELVRRIGWFDERYLLGGNEDKDWVFRLKHANLALYESQEADYDYSWKSPLQVIGHNCRLSQPHWDAKWNLRYDDAIIKMLPEQRYEHWDLFLGDAKPDIAHTWGTWDKSTLNIGYDKPNSGHSASSMFRGRPIVHIDQVRHLIK